MKQVLIFGLDGATFTILDDLMQRGIMPFLASVKARGASGVLRSTVPPLTPPAWTSLATGRSPGNHGITNFLQYSSAGSSSMCLISGRQLSSELLWSMVNKHGLRAGSLNFIAHNPAPKIDGYVIPGWVPWRWIKKFSHPEDLVDRLKAALPGFDLKALAMDFKEETKAIAGAEINDHAGWIRMHIRRERHWFDILRHQMQHDPCELLGIVFDGVDKIQHLLWRYIDPLAAPAEPSAEFLEIRELCWSYFSEIDSILAQTVELAGPDSMVLIVSDHGFAASREVVYINTWLEQQGLLAWNARTGCVSDESTELGEPELYHLTAIDLADTTAFATSASSNGIFIPVRDVRGPAGIAPEEYERVRAGLTEALLNECRDPETGAQLVTKVWKREEIFSGPHMGIAPDLTLELRDGGFFSVLRSTSVLKQRPEPMGSHHPDGILMACGAGIQPGARLAPCRLIDIAPTVLYALDLPIPEDLEGIVVEALFTPERLACSRPVAARQTEAVAVSDEPVPEEDQQIMGMLKALGYVE